MRSFSFWRRTAPPCCPRCAPDVRPWSWPPSPRLRRRSGWPRHFPGERPEEIRRAALECQGILGRAAALLEGGQEEDGLEETARSLSAALEGEDELALFEATQALDKLSREELTAVLDRTLIQIGARLPGSQRPRRLLAAAELLRRLRDGADLNANPGQVAGWLCAGMFLRP